MSRPRRAFLLAAALLAPALALAGCAAGMSSSGSTVEAGAGTISAVTSSLSAADLWDASRVHDIQLDVDETALQEALTTYADSGEKVWIEASVTIDGVTFDRVGLKLKGNSSLRQVTADTDPATIPWRIQLDKYVDGQTWDGQSDLVVRGNSSATSLNEAVALALLGASGLASESAVAAAFSVNGATAQLRLVIQNPDDAWTDDALGDGVLLYKSEAQGSWDYVGDDPADYADSFDQEAGDEDAAPLIDFLEFVNDSDDATFAAQLAEHLDVDAFATYLAFQDLVGNTDDIDGPGNNSYLAYDPATGLMTVVSWDLNLAFGASPGGVGGGQGGGPGGGFAPGAGGGPQGTGTRPDVGQAPGAGAGAGAGAGGMGGGPSGGNVLAERFQANAEFAALVDTAAERLQAELVDSGTAAGILASWTDLLVAQAGDLVDAETVRTESASIAAALGID
jgi:spore coat protein CotH